MKLLVKSSIVLLISLLFGSSAFTQSTLPRWVPSTILVQLEEDTSIDEIKGLISNRVPQEVKLESAELLSIPMRIHKLVFDNHVVNDRDLLMLVRDTRGVAIAQFDHYVELRETEPDDPGYVGQWQYNNTGQTGGTPGADIDMDTAWDTTTGGLTATGDTIVVCIIDNGVDGDHPDIEPNLWFNHAEIPNNGIDDDDNGFIDDVRGWDTGSNSDAVYDQGGHGTPVTGIIGAKGNNGIGVAGVNWDVKLMIVQGGTGIESEVLEAYSYPLTMRKKYNQSGGEEGAFVVATNSSWGNDFGQVSDAPLWCAFYDSLGTAGILNCGATINSGVNVDVVGDLPTACPSDYLISVTNTNHNDQKVGGAGFGSMSIDLGAPGEGTYTATNGANYSTFGGTSGATPHVAGAIGLLYSVPCPSIMALAYESPELAAELMRDAILNGVDPNQSLEGITVTGGRLNVANSMSIVMENCGECPLPFIVQSQAESMGTLTLTWSLPADADLPTIEYREEGTSDWNAIESVSSPITLSNISSCTQYEYRFSVVCNDETIYSAIQQLQSGGCCEQPEGLTVQETFADAVTITWDDVLAAMAYDIRYRAIGGSWIESEIPAQGETNLQGLISCTEYEFQVRTICADSSQTYSPSVFFVTAGCGACTDIDYCEITDLQNDAEWISEVNIGEWSLTSGPGITSYEDLTDIETDITLYQGQEYFCSLVPGFSGQTWNEFFKVYIDLDLDGQFSEENEVVFVSPESSSVAVEGAIYLDSIPMSGFTRMRVIMQFNAEPLACESTSNFGEVEDYCINIVSGALSVNELENLESLRVLPNPFQDRFEVSVQSNQQSHYTWSISDLFGRQIHSGVLNGLSPIFSIDMGSQASGMYVFTLMDAKGNSLTKKVIKE